MIKNKSPLSHLYSSSTMEWHHFKQGVFILGVSKSLLLSMSVNLNIDKKSTLAMSVLICIISLLESLPQGSILGPLLFF